MDCSFGALGELADKVDGFLDEIEAQIQKIQQKINQIPAMIDFELAKHIKEIKEQLEEQFPLLQDLKNLKLALPEELKQAIQLAQDAIAIKNAVEGLAEKYKDFDVEVLKDPTKLTDMLRDLQGDLNKLCDMLPKITKDEDGKIVVSSSAKTYIGDRVLEIEIKGLLTKNGRKRLLAQGKTAIDNIRFQTPSEEGIMNRNAQNTYY